MIDPFLEIYQGYLDLNNSVEFRIGQKLQNMLMRIRTPFELTQKSLKEKKRKIKYRNVNDITSTREYNLVV